jgi:hypothetical protein
MIDTKKNKSASIKAIDVIGFLSALFYLQSVLTVAYHISLWEPGFLVHTVEPPAIAWSVIGILLAAYSTYKNKMTITTLNVITLSIIATASLFWFSGLKANFF